MVNRLTDVNTDRNGIVYGKLGHRDPCALECAVLFARAREDLKSIDCVFWLSLFPCH